MGQRQHPRLPQDYRPRLRRGMNLWTVGSGVIDRLAIGTETNASFLNVGGDIGVSPVPEPPDPATGECVVWLSDGTDDYDVGDVIVKANIGGDPDEVFVKRIINHGVVTGTTYTVSCVDGAGESTTQEIIRLTGSDESTDDVVLEAGTGLSIARDGDKITFASTGAGGIANDDTLSSGRYDD